ncbi:glycosyl hydrolase family 28-related protein [Leclercia adecarboxylata]|uniref:glycosyl hydrolase family 28-related protein n=1 Tax=Leclercia adecarboxylata TaxID=83655 RepID=UPI003AFA9638
MTTYFTKEPLGSSSPYVLFDNSQNFDFALNDITQAIWLDRFGRGRQTYWGMELRFNQFISDSGYKVVGDYVNGPLTITEYNQVIRYQNELWKLNAATSIPFTTTGKDSTSWAIDSLHLVSVGDGALRQQISDPDGATKYPELQIARWRDEGDIRGWGAEGDGTADDTAAILAAMAAKGGGDIKFPAGRFLITQSLVMEDKFYNFRGAGVSSTTLLYRPSSPGVLFNHSHTVAKRGVMSISDMSLLTDVAGAGIAIYIEAKLTGESIIVNGGDDTLFLNNVVISQEGGGYWKTFLHSLHNGGTHLKSTSFLNSIEAAQNDTNVTGILLESTDPRVSCIRTITADDFYIQSTNTALHIKTTGSKPIESVYMSNGEIFKCAKSILVSGELNAAAFSHLHVDVTDRILDCSTSRVVLARFIGCDLRRRGGGSGPHFSVSTGEMLTITGCQISGVSTMANDPLNKAFEILGAYKRFAVSGCAFRNLNGVVGNTPGCELKLSGCTYNFVTNVLSGDPGDTSLGFADAVISKSVPIALTASATQDVSVPVPAGYIEAGRVWPIAMLQLAQNPGSDTLSIFYDFTKSSDTVCVFTIKGSSSARTLRFSFLAMGTNNLPVIS